MDLIAFTSHCPVCGQSFEAYCKPDRDPATVSPRCAKCRYGRNLYAFLMAPVFLLLELVVFCLRRTVGKVNLTRKTHHDE